MDTKIKRLQIILFIGLLLCSRSIAFAIGSPSRHSLVTFETGITTFRPYALNNFLFGENGQPFSSLKMIGATRTGRVETGTYSEFDASVGFHFFVPQEIIVNPDTLKYRLGGWQVMTSIYGFDLFPDALRIDLVVAPGMYWGSLRLRKYNSTGNFKSNEIFKNPFIAPMMRTDVRLVIGKIVLGGRVSWCYDISGSKWKKGSSVTLPGYKREELEYVLYIGWSFKPHSIVRNHV